MHVFGYFEYLYSAQCDWRTIGIDWIQFRENANSSQEKWLAYSVKANKKIPFIFWMKLFIFIPKYGVLANFDEAQYRGNDNNQFDLRISGERKKQLLRSQFFRNNCRFPSQSSTCIWLISRRNDWENNNKNKTIITKWVILFCERKWERNHLQRDTNLPVERISHMWIMQSQRSSCHELPTKPIKLYGFWPVGLHGIWHFLRLIKRIHKDANRNCAWIWPLTIDRDFYRFLDTKIRQNPHWTDAVHSTRYTRWPNKTNTIKAFHANSMLWAMSRLISPRSEQWWCDNSVKIQFF